MRYKKIFSLTVVTIFLSVIFNANLVINVKAQESAVNVIYSNDFENVSYLPQGKSVSDLARNVNGSTALGYDVKFDTSSTWDEKVGMDLNYEYTKPINSGTKLQLDLLLPAKSTYTGSLKVAGVAKMGSSWIWTQSNTIPEINASDFAKTGDGYMLKTVEIPFGDEITTNTGLHQIIIKIAGYQCNYVGKIYVDNVKLINGNATSNNDVYVNKTAKPNMQTKVDPNKLNIPSSVALVDDNATKSTTALYAYLKGIGKSRYTIYGHQNDTTHKSVLQNSGTNSDTKDMTGSVAGLCGIDALSMTGAELSLKPGEIDFVSATADASISAAKEGAVIELSAHMPNFAEVAKKSKINGKYDYSGYTPNVTSGNVVSRILPGGDLNSVYTGYLDMIANYGQQLQKQDISVLFRPFHENNGSWFWWGAAYCDSAAFKNAYRYTVEYLRDVKNIHNFIYVYSPNGPFTSEEDYLNRYPGDSYVDVLGLDMYEDNPTLTDNTWINSFKSSMNIIDEIAEKNNKLSAVSEVGINNMKVSGNQDKDWFNQILNAVSPTNMSYFMTWANFGEKDGFYEPYMVSTTRGHEMVNNFIDFYNQENSVFADGIGDYKSISVVNEKAKITGYITSPASGSRVLDDTTITANIENNYDKSVKFVLKDSNENVKYVVPGIKSNRNVYMSKITKDMLKNISPNYGSIELRISGIPYDEIKVLYNIPEQKENPANVDDFEFYYGNNDLLAKNWTTNTGTNCSLSLKLTSDSSQHNSGKYGLTFNYNITGTKESEGWAGITKKQDVDWSKYNALQLWIKPDGYGQKLVIQITSNGEDFEVYLPEFASTTKAQVLTIPFSKFVGKKKGVFDPSKVTSVGIWCNTIVPQGKSNITVNSTMYFDDIKAVNTNDNANNQNSQSGIDINNTNNTNNRNNRNDENSGNSGNNIRDFSSNTGIIVTKFSNNHSKKSSASSKNSQLSALPKTGSIIDTVTLICIGLFMILIGLIFTVVLKITSKIKIK